MKKPIAALLGLTLSLPASASIVSLDSAFGTDTITRDTSTGLDWLDVTVTRNLSYDQVTAQLGIGGAYEGWRYATMAEFDQLITNFGYVAIDTNCANGGLYCDLNLTGDSLLIEHMIKTLGDTFDAGIDELNTSQNILPDGAGYTQGILGTPYGTPTQHVTGLILDREISHRTTGALIQDDPDIVISVGGYLSDSTSQIVTGSFLVQASPVPLPAAAWFFASSIAFLLGLRSKKVISPLPIKN